jgi:hypothetical protein
MDENHMTTLTEAQYEWALRLVHILHPVVYEGVHIIYNEALDICRKSDEDEKYLMTFQNFLSRIPKWSEEILQKEVSRIVDKSGCTYLTDLITCVHITHLKILTSIRTSKTQKKIDIIIPKLSAFIHKVYINLSRALYSNVFLFDKDVPPLVFQKNKSEFNKMIKSAILDSIRESIPVEQLLRSYLDESSDLVREDVRSEDPPAAPKPPPVPVPVVEEVTVVVDEPKVVEPDISELITTVDAPKTDPVLELLERPTIKFSNVDYAFNHENKIETITAPKDIETLEILSEARNAERKAQEALEDDEGKLQFGSELASADLNIEVLS